MNTPTKNSSSPRHRGRAREFVIPAIIVVAVVAAVNLNDVLSAVKHQRLEAAFERRVTQGRFLSLDEIRSIEHTIQQRIADVDKTGPQRLTPDMSEGLREKLVLALRAYHEGSFDIYSAFRYPAAVRRDQGMNPTFREHMPIYVKALEQDPRTRPLLESDAEDRAQFSAFQRFLRADYQSYVVRHDNQSDVRLCTDCWDQMNIETFRLELKTFDHKVGSIRAWLDESNSFGAMSHPRNPYIDPSPEQVVKRHGSLLSAWAGWTIMTTGRKADPLPLFLHLYWAPEHREWIPFELVVGSEKAPRYFHHF